MMHNQRWWLAIVLATLFLPTGLTPLAAAEAPKSESPNASDPTPTRGSEGSGSNGEPRSWLPLSADGLHDPSNPSLRLLQNPAEALSALPPAHEGNQVDWAAALRSGAISPRTNIYPETKISLLDLDILMDNTAGMPIVRFPHRPHTEWLDCNNCHDRLFIPKAGANPINMFSILQGKFCGQCHGAVSFPLTQCYRCHSVDRPKPATTTSGHAQ